MTDESVCPTLVHKGLRFCGAGASACHTEAEPLYQRALAIREKALGPDHPDTAISVRNYAQFLRERGRAAEAEKLEARFKASGR